MFISFYLIDMLVSILFQSEYTHCDMKEQRHFSLIVEELLSSIPETRNPVCDRQFQNRSTKLDI